LIDISNANISKQFSLGVCGR